MTSFMYIDNKNKDILIPSEGPTQGLDNITLTAEAKYPINSAHVLVSKRYRL